ncbi:MULTISPECIES: pca operon transcription factor PcaQ [unclassified Halomonas]|jgi:LysR family pca operon transcriptional activator|uniref:pca operon transcription factor PcaQ n=1 Tax=unclassified Halomonas TaxID=2609666 RepID=UPI000780B154|nr:MULTISPECIES: pca operon transcription factor PcaQ [unclassified Halomonas]MCO7242523.1 pca operon transcription factor PcaQ [Halomonas sp. Ps84H-12]|tara:strand:+ start:302 stop:1234 length:933 start_codon:yes stop_codon:yes gene_type:complete
MLNARIKLRHLQAFLEVARQRSFARAAERLSITQPGISKTIRELEDTLAVSLFERTPKGISLTQAGLTLLRHAGPAVRTLEEGVKALQAVQEGSHWLRIGALSTAESRLLPEALRRWQVDTATERGAQVVTGTSAFLLSRLRRGELDVVVGRMTEAREIHDLSFEHLYYERLQLVVRAGHPLLAEQGLTADKLCAYPWIVPPPQTTLRQQVDSFFVRHGLSLPTQRIETLSLALGLHYTLIGEAIWVAPEEAVRSAQQREELYELTLPLELNGGSVGLCINRSLHPTLATEAFCEVLREVASDVVKGHNS